MGSEEEEISEIPTRHVSTSTQIHRVGGTTKREGQPDMAARKTAAKKTAAKKAPAKKAAAKKPAAKKAAKKKK